MFRVALAALYALLTLLLVFFQETFLFLMVWVALGYFLWRLTILFAHGFSHCVVCQLKLVGAVIVFLTVLLFSRVEVAYFLIFFLWLDFFAKDKHQGQAATFY